MILIGMDAPCSTSDTDSFDDPIILRTDEDERRMGGFA